MYNGPGWYTVFTHATTHAIKNLIVMPVILYGGRERTSKKKNPERSLSQNFDSVSQNFDLISQNFDLRDTKSKF